MLANELENDKHIIHIHTKEAKYNPLKKLVLQWMEKKGQSSPLKCIAYILPFAFSLIRVLNYLFYYISPYKCVRFIC